MLIEFGCRNCRATLGFDESLSGEFINCPSCHRKTVIPLWSHTTLLECPKCETEIKVDRHSINGTAFCPECKSKFAVSITL